MRTGKLRNGAILAATLIVAAPAGADDVSGDACISENGITPICGFESPEDIEVTPGGDALIVGGFNLDNANGDIRVLDLGTNRIEVIFDPDAANYPPAPVPGWGDPACPGAPSGFAAHGIHLSANAMGSLTLLVVNHTSREAIEVFEITERGAAMKAAWRGCVIVDPPLWVNDVAMLGDGALVASHMMPRETAHTMFDRPPDDDVETGYLVEWGAATGWTIIPNSEGALPNGVQVSPDGRTIFNNHYLGNQVVAIDRESGERLWTATMTAAPDNMSITADGQLLVAMHRVSLRAIRDECMLRPLPWCGLGFAVAYIDPESGQVTPVIESGGPSFGGTTVAVETGGSIYLGTFAGNRIGRIPAPAR